MTYEDWLETVPSELANDPLWKMEVYRLAIFLTDLAWHDVTKLYQDKRTIDVAGQLFRAVGSVGADVSEGYSRRSGKDQARFFEYSLGSARESRGWYYQARHALNEQVALHRMQLTTHIIRLLLAMIPSTRGQKFAEAEPVYELYPFDPREEIPFS